MMMKKMKYRFQISFEVFKERNCQACEHAHSGAMKQMPANSSLLIITGLFHVPFDLTKKKKEAAHFQEMIFRRHRGLFLSVSLMCFSLVTQTRVSGSV